MARDDNCPYCGLHPYDYVDIGVGSQAIAVNCCQWGYLLFDKGMKKSEVDALIIQYEKEKREEEA